MQDNQLGVGRTGDEIERHAIALAVAVGPRGTDFEPGAFLAAFLLDDRVNAMRRAVAVGFSRHGVVLSALEPAPMAASMPLTGRSVQAGLSQPGRQATRRAWSCTSCRRGSERL